MVTVFSLIMPFLLTWFFCLYSWTQIYLSVHANRIWAWMPVFICLGGCHHVVQYFYARSSIPIWLVGSVMVVDPWDIFRPNPFAMHGHMRRNCFFFPRQCVVYAPPGPPVVVQLTSIIVGQGGWRFACSGSRGQLQGSRFGKGREGAVAHLILLILSGQRRVGVGGCSLHQGQLFGGC